MDSPQPKRTFKRSIDDIITVFTKKKSGEVEAIKSALLNVGVLIILAAFAAVFLVLMPFLNPLLWAFLFGAVLFPAKYKLSNAIHSWIDNVATNELPVALAVVTIPLNLVVDVGEKLTGWLIEHSKMLIIGLMTIIGLRLVVYFVPASFFSSILSICLKLYTISDRIVDSMSLTLILLVVTGYGVLLFMLWNESTSKVFTIGGQAVWILVVGYCCTYLGSFQTPAFLFALVYAAAGFVYESESGSSEILGSLKKLVVAELPSPQVEAVEESVSSQPEPEADTTLNKTTRMGSIMKDTLNLSQISEIKQRMKLNFEEKKSHPGTTKKVELESDFYMKILGYGCLATMLWHQIWILLLSFIPICIYALKEIVKILGFFQYVESQWKSRSQAINEWLEPRRKAVFPVCMPGVRKINKKLHKIFTEQSKLYVDDISAVAMILFLIIFVTFLSVFLFFQIYAETITVAQLGSNLINRTLTHSPELVEMLPINMQSMNDAIDNAYKYSREKIEEYVDSALNQTNPEQAEKLKGQILSLWDRLIQSYMDRNNDSIGPRVGMESILTTLDDIFVTSEVTTAGIFQWMKNNVEILKEVGDSVWIVLKANMSLLFSTTTTLLSVLFGGGQAMIKFIFNIIIFLTTLYYLLRSSQDRYLRININSTWGSKLAEALEDSVSGVLVATMKLSLFHGLFTWFTHTVFGAHVVYLPSMLASIMAAAPFVETYWCSIPAFLDLWLSQDRLYLGITLILIHFIIPSNFNPIVHSEIKGGGHPFLTALSIVGGMYLFGGIEGAIYGPLLLCLLSVLSGLIMSNLNSNANLTRQSSLEESYSESPKT